MTAELQNIKHKRGTYRVIRFGPVKDTFGDHVPLVGATAMWRMAKTPTSTGADVYVTKDTASSGGAVIEVGDWYGVPTYTVKVTLDPEDTLGVPLPTPPNKYFHECEITTADGHPIVVTTGWFFLEPSITN